MSMPGANLTPEQREADRKEIEGYLSAHEKRRMERFLFENHWQEVMEYVIPRKEDVTNTRPPGDKRTEKIFDSTAIQTNILLASALHGMLTNPESRFFELIMGDPALDGDDTVKEWLQDCAQRMFVVLSNSNFQTEVHEIYLDEGAIGTACLYMGESDLDVIHFNARHMKEIFVDEDNLGRIDTVDRKFKWKARQIIQEFGEQGMDPWILEQHQKGSGDELDVIHTVFPEYDVQRGKIFPFKSCYYLSEQKIFLSKRGYREFPYAVPRWTKTSGEKYGRGPGMEMLPDIKMVNAMMDTVIRGAQKTVDPPMIVQDDSVIGRVRLTPGGQTIVRPFTDVPLKPLITDARIDFGQQVVEDVRRRIRAGFFVDQLQLQQGNPQMTATEVSQRAEENLRLMGPVLGRQHFEFLRPLINRVFGIMSRRNLFKPAPPQIQGKKFDVRYSSLMARAQRMSEGQNFTRAISVAAPLVQAKPEVLDNLRGDDVFKYIMDIYGVPTRLLEQPRAIQGIRDARAKANQQVAQEKQQAAQADIASKMMPGMAQIQQASQTGGSA